MRLAPSAQRLVRAPAQFRCVLSPRRPAASAPPMFMGPGSERLLSGTACSAGCSKWVQGAGRHKQGVGDTPLVTDAELPELLASVPSWKHDKERHLLTRKFVARNFMAAITFFNKVAEIAEDQGHHPDLHLTNYREVEVNVYTHAAGGITKPDFTLAAKLDRIEVEYSPKWLKQQQEAAAATKST